MFYDELNVQTSVCLLPLTFFFLSLSFSFGQPNMHAIFLLLLVSSVHSNSILPSGKALPKKATRRTSCVRCCSSAEQPVSSRYVRMSSDSAFSMPKVQPRIDITILKGEQHTLPTLLQGICSSAAPQKVQILLARA